MAGYFTKAEIKKREMRFKRATPLRKKVLIAREVVDLLKTKRVFNAETGNTYLQANGPLADRYGSLNHELRGKNFRDELAKNARRHDRSGPSCTVCGIGGVFVATVMLKNECDIDGLLTSRPHMVTFLEPYFDFRELGKIETAFEGSYLHRDGLTMIEGLKSIPYKEADDRLAWIMNDIIKNKGAVFPDYVKYGA